MNEKGQAGYLCHCGSEVGKARMLAFIQILAGMWPGFGCALIQTTDGGSVYHIEQKHWQYSGKGK